MQNTQNEIYHHYLAIDWAQKNAAIATMDARSSKIESHEFLPDIKFVKNYLKKCRGKKILTIEETTTSHWLYVELKDHVDRILICNPYRNSLMKDGPQNDVIDARSLCLLLRKGMLKEVYHSMDQFYEIRKLVSCYEDFNKASVRYKNQRSALFRAQGKDHKKEKNLKTSPITDFICEKQNSAISYVSGIKQEFEKLFKKLRQGNKDLQRLNKISGLGDKTSVAILSIVIDASRFAHKGKYHGYCGLAKHEKESGGKSYGKKPIKHNKTLKCIYKRAAMCAIRGKNDIREYYEYLLQNNYPFDKARNEIARYIATSSYAVLKNKEDYRPYSWRRK